ncbi:MAG: tripartite tricarboxylate transporter substrate binding protein [Betaproteobacteria bacterium]|nr:tripartite tricarboxylate transporter substrate binding protein [Betaproteobacteria bacterium]
MSGRFVLLALSFLAFSTPLSAQQPTRIIVPYAAGGPIDLTVRALAERAREGLGPIVVENRPGAGGNLGVSMVAKAAPDGRTLGIAATATHAINPWLFNKMPFDASKDFAPITQMVRVPNVVVMNTEVADRLGIKTMNDFIRYAKANPGKLNYGSGGNGSAGHLAGEMLKQSAGIFAVHIPYNGGAPAQLGLLSGQVDFNIDNLATAAANIKSGRLRALAVTSTQRSPVLPDVPPIAESLPGFAIDTWWGIIAPAGTPTDTVNRLNQIFTSALNSPELRQRFAALLAEPTPTSAETFGRFMAQERQRYESVVKSTGARVD